MSIVGRFLCPLSRYFLSARCPGFDQGTITTADGDILYIGEPIASDQLPTRHWPDPTPEMLNDPRFEAIWQAIKTWDINVPNAYGGYCGATGNHVRAILDALAQS